MKELQAPGGLKERHTVLLESCVVCIGDPILDFYVQEDGYVEFCKGGALNVFENLSNILHESVFLDPVTNQPLLSLIKDTYYISCFNNKDIVKNYSKIIFLPGGDSLRISSEPYNYSTGSFRYLDGLKLSTVVLSDYNRGTLNNFSYSEGGHFQNISFDADLFVIDSKHRTLNLDLLGSGLKLWHAAGSEYNLAWAANFDYVVWTDGPKPVRIVDPKLQKIIATIPVPQTEVVSTCGAGDTFVAAVAAYLHRRKYSNKDQFLSLLKEATQFGIMCCQDVITQPYTSVTKHKLR